MKQLLLKKLEEFHARHALFHQQIGQFIEACQAGFTHRSRIIHNSMSRAYDNLRQFIMNIQTAEDFSLTEQNRRILIIDDAIMAGASTVMRKPIEKQPLLDNVKQLLLL